jgi:hypothetical protein
VASWPSGLPSPFAEGEPSYTLHDNAIRPDSKTGFGKSRRRFFGKYETVTFPLVLTKTQRDIFQNFYWTTLQEVLPFDWVDLREYNVPAGYRFSKPPKETYVAGDATASANSEAYWQVDVELERIS